MPRRSRQNPDVREYILRHVENEPASVASSTAKEFGLSRTAVNRYIKRLIDEGYLDAIGNTNARRYSLKTIVNINEKIDNITRHTPEDVIWRHKILPHILHVPQNVIDICQYGFTEIFNNVIDHSLSDGAFISYEQNYTTIQMLVVDYGIGIFRKIQKDFQLPDPRSALLELSKGKLTSDKKRHTGEGVFFTSRMFDEFIIKSGDLFYIRRRQSDDDWLIEAGDQEPQVGTSVQMTISTAAQWTSREIFDEYQGDDLRFRKTHVPIMLGKYPGEQLISRSQAKRVLARFDQFSEVMLDFYGVDDIGQPFADEIFRVFMINHPDIEIYYVRANEKITTMIEYVSRESQQE